MTTDNASSQTLLYRCAVVDHGWTYEVMTPGEAEYPWNAAKPQITVQAVLGKSAKNDTTVEQFRANVGSIVGGLSQKASGRNKPLLTDIVGKLVETGYVARQRPPKTL